jgi:isopenicillin N synthase-like dioxygenase
VRGQPLPRTLERARLSEQGFAATWALFATPRGFKKCFAYRDAPLVAGEHTDSGPSTRLFLWHGWARGAGHRRALAAGAAHKDTILVKAGDLLARWTRDVPRSTPHRVQRVSGGQGWYCTVLFVNPDCEVEIRAIDSCASVVRPTLHPPTAREHILRRLTGRHAGPAR